MAPLDLTIILVTDELTDNLVIFVIAIFLRTGFNVNTGTYVCLYKKGWAVYLKCDVIRAKFALQGVYWNIMVFCWITTAF